LDEIPNVSIPDGAINKYPAIPLTALNGEKVVEDFLETLDWYVEKVRASEPST